MSIGALVGRLGALALAILLVVGAFAWRNRDGGPTPSDGSSATAQPATAEPGVVWCAEELGICDTLADSLEDVEVETAPGVVTARALQEDDEVGTWVTLDALVDVAEDGRASNSLGPAFEPDPEPVATSPLVLVGWKDRMAALADACATDWACVGEVAAGTWAEAGGSTVWGDPKPAWADPDQSGIGLLVLAQAAASRLDGAALTTANLDAPEFRTWLTDLVRGASFTPSSGSVLEEMVSFGPARRDVVGTTAAQAAQVLSRAARTAELAVVAAEPPVTARAVVARPVGGDVPAGLEAAVAEALGAQGWDTGTTTSGPSLPSPVPSPTGSAPVLTGGALEAVLVRFDEVR
jgi:hypothetical protein